MKTHKPIFSPSCPKRLRTALHRAKSKNGKPWSYSALAGQLNVNKGTIHKLVTKGIPPHDEELRVKLFLPRHPRKTKPLSFGRGAGVRVALPPHQKWWRKQPKEFRNNLIYQAWLKSES